MVALSVFDFYKWYSLNLICFWVFSLNTILFSFNQVIVYAYFTASDYCF